MGADTLGTNSVLLSSPACGSVLPSGCNDCDIDWSGSFAMQKETPYSVMYMSGKINRSGLTCLRGCASSSRSKKTKLMNTVDKLTADNNVFQEIGIAATPGGRYGCSSSAAASSSGPAPAAQRGPVILRKRSRLPPVAAIVRHDDEDEQEIRSDV